MRQRFFILLSLSSLLLSLGLGACSGDRGDMPAFLEGTWISRSVSAEGEKTRFIFTGDDRVQVDAFKNTATQVLTAQVDSGTYRATTSSIEFDYNRLGKFESQLSIISDFEIVIDETTFLRANPDGTIAGGTIAGQIHINDGSDQSAAQQSLRVSSASADGLSALQVEGTAAPTYSLNNATRGVLLIQDADGGGCRKVLVEPDANLVQDTQDSGTLAQKLSAVSVQDADQAKRTEELKRQLEAEGHQVFSSGRMGLQSIPVPSDPDYWRQWDMRSINAPGGWAILDNLNNVGETKIAVVDTGKAFNQDLEGVWTSGGYDFVSECSYWGTVDEGLCGGVRLPGADGDSRDSDPTDVGDDANGPGLHSWHGTHVAGIMGAKRNRDGVTGINPEARIVPVRAIGHGGWGDIGDISDAIRYAAGAINADGSTGSGSPRAKVINLSLGCFVLDPATYNGPDPSVFKSPVCGTADATDVDDANYIMNNAIQEALSNGVVVVAAAGNCNEHQSLCNQAFYPADYPGVIKVGGIDSHGTFATSVSAYGAKQSVVAPSGGLEPSDYLGQETQVHNTVSNDYEGRVGTSQAAAFVAGLASALLSLDPNLSPAEVKSVIEDTALDIGPSGFDERHGHGLINVGAALQDVAPNLNNVPTADFIVSADRLNYGQVKTEKVVYVHRVGSGTINNISAQADVPWLDVEVSSQTAPAYVTLRVDRSQLPFGDSEAQVTINTNKGSERVDVVVSKATTTSTGGSSGGSTTGGVTGGGAGSVGDGSFEDWLRNIEGLLGGASFNNTTDVGDIYVMLVNAGTQEVVSAILTDLNANYNFEFVALPEGNYYLLAGQVTDQGQICDILNNPQVPCTAYPNYNTPEILVIEGDKVISDVTLGL